MSKFTGRAGFVVLMLVVAGMAAFCPTLPLNAQSGSAVDVPPKVAKLEESAKKSHTAKEAVTAYQIFLTDPKLTNSEKKAAEAKLAQWQKKADEDMVRLGARWVPAAEEQKLKKEADDLVKAAFKAIQGHNLNGADELLKQAAKVYPEHLDSLFLLAYGAILNDNISGAEKQFTEMLRRAPGNVAVLNNLAAAEAIGGKGDVAFRHLQMAADKNSKFRPTFDNLSAFLYVLDNKPVLKPGQRFKSPVLSASADTKEKARKLFATLSVESKFAAPPKPQWEFVMGFREGEDQTGDKDTESPESRDGLAKPAGNGTGFVVAPNYILTNRHVVADSDGLSIVDPSDPKRLFHGELVATAKDFDLAIIRCKDLNAPALPLRTTQIPRGSEVMALGFPISNIVGRGLKSTRGSVTGMPSKETEGMMVLDVQINPGNSGGPLCDVAGRVAGINTAVTFSDRFIKGYGLALAIGEAIPFLKQHIPQFEAKTAPDAKLEWSDVDAAVSQSTVMVLILKKASGPGGAPKKEK